LTDALALSSLSAALLGRREKLALLAALLAVAALAWGYLIVSAAHMDMVSAAHAAMGRSEIPWSAAHFVLTLAMWAVMMVAMMLPSAAPMVLTYAAVVGRVAPSQGKRSSVTFFVTAYLIVWFGFSVGATLLQAGLERAAVLSQTTMAVGPLLGGALLIIAGLYQWSPVKEFCLRNCQSPLIFIASNWHPGLACALRMGLSHGAFCVGCCWALMLLLFIGGVMNPLWVAAIAIFVLLEKLIGPGQRVGRWVSGGALVGAGVFLLVAGYGGTWLTSIG
jgi:predicted metal-binding membrane protein